MFNKTRITRFVLFTSLLALLPVVISIFPRDTSKMIMAYDDSRAMANEVANKIPVGSTARSATQIMQRNGFKLTKHTSAFLEFEKEDSGWPDDNGSLWIIDINLRDGFVIGNQAWIDVTG